MNRRENFHRASLVIAAAIAAVLYVVDPLHDELFESGSAALFSDSHAMGFTYGPSRCGVTRRKGGNEIFIDIHKWSGI